MPCIVDYCHIASVYISPIPSVKRSEERGNARKERYCKCSTKPKI